MDKTIKVDSETHKEMSELKDQSFIPIKEQVKMGNRLLQKTLDSKKGKRE